MVSPDDFEKADETTLLEIVREAEAYLSAQLTSTLAANSRAMSFTGFLTAIIVILAGYVVNAITSKDKLLLAALAGLLLIGLLCALWFSIKAASPMSFWYVGNTPAQWVADVQYKKSLHRSRAEQVVHYAEMIEDNNRCMRDCSRCIVLSMRISWSSFLVCGLLLIAAIYSGLI